MQLENTVHTHDIKQVEPTTCCIVGGGPGGAMLALLLARKGVPVTLLEAHMDFDRDFRGDTLHPATMEIMDEIGLADKLLQLRHSKLSQFTLSRSTRSETLADFSRLKTKYPYVTVISQARFLDFITTEAKHYPDFHLIMGAQVDELIEENGVVRGVRYRGHDGYYEMQADVVVGADGRFSRIRKLLGFEPIKTSSPMDILWFRLSRREDDPLEGLGGRLHGEGIVVVINRFDYWQVGYVIPKGGYQRVRAAGLEEFQQAIARAVPELADRVTELKEWKQISLLSVESSRIPRWYRPGVLLIGDAAHVMSPVGGVGINYAIQDAVVAANVLADKLKNGAVQVRDLAKVQRKRELPTRIIQLFQARTALSQIHSPIQDGRHVTRQEFRPSPVLLMMRTIPFLRNMPARIMAFGLWPAHVKE